MKLRPPGSDISHVVTLSGENERVVLRCVMMGLLLQGAGSCRASLQCVRVCVCVCFLFQRLLNRLIKMR